MNKYGNGIGLTLLLIILVMGSCSSSKKMLSNKQINPGIDIVFEGEAFPDSVYVIIAPIPTDTTMVTKEYCEAVHNGRKDVYGIKDGVIHISPDTVSSQYQILCDNYILTTCNMRSLEHIALKVKDFTKRQFELTGGVYSYEISHYSEFLELRSKLFKISRHKFTEQELDSLTREMHSLIDIIMIESHPEAATRAASYLEEDFVPYAFDKLPPGSENTLYYTDVRARRNSGVRNAEQEALLNSSLESSAPVPEITLNSLDGQTFHISELRGKWVILDFWVSWCAPCRRGFEKMKQLYANYGDKLEIVGIACGDHEETWSKLVAELELPWRNYLAPSPESQNGIVAGFPVPAFPTKVMIDPEGRLRDFTVGEDENFYNKFEKIIK